MKNDANDKKKGMDLDVIDLSSILKKDPAGKDSGIAKKKGPKHLPKEDAPETTGNNIEAPYESQIQSAKGTEQKKTKFRLLVWVIPILIGLSVFALLFSGSLSLKNDMWKDAPKPLNNLILDVKGTTGLLKKAINHLDKISNKVNSPKKIIQVLDAIKKVEDILPVYETRINNLAESIQENKKGLEEKNLGVLLELGDYYRGKPNTHYLQSLKKCMAVQKKYLTYYNDKYDLIINRQQPQIQSYEAFYLQYKRAFGEYDKANNLQSNFIEAFLDKYPSAQGFFLYEKKTGFFSWFN